jgi:hypothetical protein
MTTVARTDGSHQVTRDLTFYTSVGIEQSSGRRMRTFALFNSTRNDRDHLPKLFWGTGVGAGGGKLTICDI